MTKPIPTLLTLLLLSQAAWALSPAGTRGLRNVQTAIGSVQLLPELRQGPIPGDKMQTAKNLLRDLDSAVSRGKGELDRLSDADRSDPQVAEALRKIEEFAAFRADLQQAIDGAASASAASDAQFRAFREETRSFATVVGVFRKGPGGSLEQVKAGVEELAKLDALCRSKYPGIRDDPKLSFALNIEPGTWCSVAARREELALATYQKATAGALQPVLAQVKEAKDKLAPNNGLLGVDDLPYQLLQNRPAIKARMVERLKPLFDAAGQTMPADYFVALDAQLDAFAAEIERLAPTWKFEATHADAATEGGARKAFTEVYKGRSVVKTGLLYGHASIAKTPAGIPTERYRTGALLAKAPGTWCEYRQFTAHEAYSGGGTYAPPRYTFGAMRLQGCS